MTKVSIIDMIAKKLRRCIAIVEEGDTASQAIASGKFVIWKGNPCKASTAISAGDTLSSSNLTALSDGIGNELNGKLTKQSGTMTPATGVSITSNNVSKVLDVVWLYLTATKEQAITRGAWNEFATLPVGFRPSTSIFTTGIDNNHDISCNVYITTNGVISVYGASANEGMKALLLNCTFIE